MPSNNNKTCRAYVKEEQKILSQVKDKPNRKYVSQ
jgi:hypothetical protein